MGELVPFMLRLDSIVIEIHLVFSQDGNETSEIQEDDVFFLWKYCLGLYVKRLILTSSHLLG